ncbi:MAG: 50S ribosomal protein L5 [Patescibacteria group bacterium]|nr:50S ribosomal protein L5 [Patescibacteria group bacterium]
MKSKVKAQGKLNKRTLWEKYRKEIVPRMMKKFGYKSPMAVPRLEKIVLNTGIGPWSEDEEAKESIRKDMSLIAGQKAVYTKARQAISGFKVKIGQKVGVKATIRGKRMFDFLERLIVEALPRVRDFRGISENNFGFRGSVNIGMREHTAFAEIDSEKAQHVFGLEINIVSTAQDKKQGLELLRLFGFPIRKGEETGIEEKIKSRREEAKEKDKKEKKKK